MEKTIQIWLDEELQVVRQRLAGDLEEGDVDCLVADTQGCVDRMKDPGNVRILVDARGLGRSNAKIRKALINEQKRSNLTKMALWGGPLLVRTTIKFFSLADPGNKARHFKTEQEALAWLLG